ncbi:carbon-nitrogen hydrolase [Gonapodya prolifera JEL478]|uniref:Carbon-nitrogen hydrolase n=1 Tax=Gonapodya prolifera (strain JEL478) TaxID=1344416 RepID=A0A139A9G3_GONPJ|nr:carbon-nitrogen hydrolase [Gonapodya prolifera JEL478]|eukprot:KXS13324.1 carbon-nitrogen hydrolase [Gonapodya prolifera JEL478]
MVGANKAENLLRARTKVLEAKDKGANVVVLPECFNSPYGVKFFPDYAEVIPGESTNALSAIAKDARVWLIGGSIPERDPSNSRLYNTCTVYNPTGTLVATHRKVHLFDIDVPGKIRFKESEVLTGGDKCTIVDTEYGKIGVAICYDIRFPELAMVAARRGAVAMIYPGAFNTVTGPLHWELLQRARAVDNQIYVACCSPARVQEPKEGDYLAWGHSTVVNPSGAVVATTDEAEATVYHDIDPAEIAHWRSSIPVVSQRRFDVYDDVSKVLVYEN